MQMQAKRVLITGGGQGIGKGMAQRFLAAGCRVLLAEHDMHAGEQAVGELAALGEVHALGADVGNEDDIVNLERETTALFGGLDVLVNNAGIMLRKPLTEVSLAEWNRVLAVNLTAAFLCARAFAPALRQAGGTIVNIASTRSLMSEPDTEAYAASKGGLVALTHSLAVSLGPQVRVNCISPGWIDVSAWHSEGAAGQEELTTADHNQHPAGRVGTPADVAELALYLASPASAFVTGQNFIIDGGMTRKMIYV